MSSAGYYQSNRGENVVSGRNADGDHEEYYSGEGGPGIRTHDYSNEDEVNEKLFGKGAAVKRTNTSSRINQDGDKEEFYDGDDNGPRIRTHDHSNEDEINERLFGKGAVKPKKSSSRSNSSENIESYRNADGDKEEAWKGDAAPGIRTHDFSDEKEINERLFGKGARSD